MAWPKKECRCADTFQTVSRPLRGTALARDGLSETHVIAGRAVSFGEHGRSMTARGKAEGFDLRMPDRLDEPFLQKLADYEGKKFVSIQEAHVKLEEVRVHQTMAEFFAEAEELEVKYMLKIVLVERAPVEPAGMQSAVQGQLLGSQGPLSHAGSTCEMLPKVSDLATRPGDGAFPLCGQ